MPGLSLARSFMQSLSGEPDSADEVAWLLTGPNRPDLTSTCGLQAILKQEFETLCVVMLMP